jgi:2',3'-cyclic-nucleotide 2'-phosphodiesterase (5'-nucleotidase family)
MLLLDAGNFSDNPTAAGDMKTRGLLQAMERLGYRVVNVGERDIRMGYPEFARRTAGTSLRYISANIVDRKTKKPIFEPHVVIEAPAPDDTGVVRVGVVGAVRYNPVFLKAGPDGGNIVIAHPLDAVKREVEALRKKDVDVVVLLAALHKNDAKSLALQVPDLDFVLGSYGGLVTATAEQHGDATLLYCGNRGQRIGESRVFFGEGKQGKITNRLNKLHVLSRLYPSDRDMLDFVNSLLREAPSAEVPATSSAPAERSGGTVRAGS